MEATGSYHENLAWLLFDQGKTVHIVLPNKAKYYLKSKGYRSKNDKIDAQGLAYLGMEQTLETWQPMSKLLYKLRGLTRHVEQLKKVKTMFCNQLEGVKHGMFALKSAEKSLKKQIKGLDKQIEELEQEIEKLVKTDEDLAHQVETLTSIKGVGVLAAVTILAETNGFLLFKNQKQLTSYAGYDVLEKQSGERAGKSRISKKGNAHIRRILHFPAFNVVTYDQGTFKKLYERVYARTGEKMKAYVAVQRQLLCLLYTLHKRNTPFDPDYHKIERGKAEPSSCETEKL